MKKLTALVIGLTALPMIANAEVKNLSTAGSGWNLVAACGSTITEMLNGQDQTKIEQLQDQNGNSYSVQLGFGLLSNLSEGKGYWVKAVDTATVDTGELSSDTTVSLVSSGSGWNLVGVCSDTTISEFLGTNTSAEIEQIQDQNGNSYSLSLGFGLLNSLEKGKAYWVKALQDTSIVVEADGSSSLNTDGWYQEVVTTTSNEATKTTTVSLPVGSYTVYADLAADSAAGTRPVITIADASSNTVTTQDTAYGTVPALKAYEFDVTTAQQYTLSISDSAGINGDIWIGVVKSDATYAKTNTLAAGESKEGHILLPREQHIWTLTIAEAGSYSLTALAADTNNPFEQINFVSFEDASKKDVVFSPKKGEVTSDFTVLEGETGTFTLKIGSTESDAIGSYTLELTKN